MALQITTNINVDFYDNKYIMVQAKQYDDRSRLISVTCYNQGSPYNLSSGSHTAYIKFKKANGRWVLNSCSINHKGEILVELTEQMLASAGICYVDLFIVDKGSAIVNIDTGRITTIDGSSVLTTKAFCIDVQEAVVDNSLIESIDEYEGLTDLIEMATAEYSDVVNLAKSWAIGTGNDARENDEEDNSKYYSKMSKSYAIGNAGGMRTNEDTDNSKYYSEIASQSASDASASATASENSATSSANSATASASSATDSANSAAASAKSALESLNSATDSAASAAASEASATESEESMNSASASATSASASAISASTSASSASVSATNASDSASSASASEANALESENSALASASNALISANSASDSATSASNSAASASASAASAMESAENVLENVDIVKGYTSEAENSMNSASTSATNAATSESNAYTYYLQVEEITTGLSGAFMPMRTIEFAELATLLANGEVKAGYLYNISDDFTTDESFQRGAGVEYPAGTNVYMTSTGVWDCLTGTTVTGVKGEAEIEYRKGNVSLTPENIGAVSSTDIATVDEVMSYLSI